MSQTLQPFPNGATPTLEWPETRKAIINLYTRCLPGRPLGLIDAIMSIEDIRTHFNKPAGFHMTPLMDHPGADAPNGKEFTVWDRKISIWAAQEAARSSTCDQFYACLGPVPRRLVDPDDAGSNFFDPMLAFEQTQSGIWPTNYD